MLVSGLALSAQALGQNTSLAEFTSGQIATFSSVGHAKAKGVDVKFDYPKSWLGEEGKRPSTLFQVTSDGGKGLEFCNLSIIKVPFKDEANPTEDEVSDFFEPEGLATFIPPGSDYLGAEKIKVNGKQAASIFFKHDDERAGVKLRTIWVVSPIYFDKKMVILACMSGEDAKNPEQNTHNRFATYRPLYKRMLDSVVISALPPSAADAASAPASAATVKGLDNAASSPK